ncbi:ATP-binding protein [Desulfobacter latus]|uniref:ATP-binding protein n=1 Tax=Desulfobacter latus TaxID=2292 RepID=A0A850T6X0_9BACT|nr:ATP-binding protein [Desulfobacter latus]
MEKDTLINENKLSIRSDKDYSIISSCLLNILKKIGVGTLKCAQTLFVCRELAVNVLVHGKGGDIIFSQISNANGQEGVRLTFSDKGPGIPDIRKALKGGFSTTGSLGVGLSTARDLSDDMHIESSSEGTTITVWVWK